MQHARWLRLFMTEFQSAPVPCGMVLRFIGEAARVGSDGEFRFAPKTIRDTVGALRTLHAKTGVAHKFPVDHPLIKDAIDAC